MDDATLTLTSATMEDHRIMEQLLMIMVIHSLLRKEEGAANNNDARELRDMVREFSSSMAINNRRDQSSAVSKELLLVASQRLLDAQLRLFDDGEQGRLEVSPSASDHQLMDSAAAAKKKAAAGL
jgi:hypothetical protein